MATGACAVRLSRGLTRATGGGSLGGMFPPAVAHDMGATRCGIGRRIAALSSPQNRTHPFRSMRLPGQVAYPLYWQGRIAPRWVCLQPHGLYLTSATVPLCSPASSPDPLPHVGPLSGWVSPLTRPYPVSYEFLVPFGCWPSLLGTSCPPGDLFRPRGWPTDREGKRPRSAVRPQEGFHIPHP